jgi:hypothetical protein
MREASPSPIKPRGLLAELLLADPRGVEPEDLLPPETYRQLVPCCDLSQPERGGDMLACFLEVSNSNHNNNSALD